LAGVTAVVSKTEGMDKLVACVHSLLNPAQIPEGGDAHVTA
jgi:hypothetical protein